MVKVVKFMLHIFYHNLKKFLKNDGRGSPGSELFNLVSREKVGLEIDM